MASRESADRWALKVVRGRAPGLHHELAAGENLLGNALGGASGFELSGQEASTTRLMAPRQACLTMSRSGLSIRDLDSPGGTFVNRQRLLTGQERVLQPGDVIQVGSVQLQVLREGPDPTAATAPPLATKPGSLPVPYPAPGSSTCRTWDDFQTLAAQRWGPMREELTSGRLGDYLRRIGRVDLLPETDPDASADDRLDAWLARLPATRPGGPELDVYPQTLVIRAPAGGGLVRQSVRITNLGYRLLRGEVRVEQPEGRSRIRLGASFPAGPFATIDQTEVPVEVEVPEDLAHQGPSAVLGAIVVESNGGRKRVEIKAERPAPAIGLPDSSGPAVAVDALTWARPLGVRIAAQPLGRRIALAASLCALFRLLAMAAGSEPQLAMLAMILGAVGVLAGAAWGWGSRDAVPGAFTGGVIGVLAAAVGFALIQSVESLTGPWSGSSLWAVVLWGLLGCGLALLSWMIQPPSSAASSPAMGNTR